MHSTARSQCKSSTQHILKSERCTREKLNYSSRQLSWSNSLETRIKPLTQKTGSEISSIWQNGKMDATA
eukprot:5967237-Amphidinium_carterae.1